MKLKNKTLSGFKVYYRNEKELNIIFLEIFILNDYKFTTREKRPFIIDCGSHIGLSILYFKQIYPEAEILGFEPNPENFEILKKNIRINKLKNVRLVNAALSNKDGVAVLHTDINKNDSLTWGDTTSALMAGGNTESIPVDTFRLSKFINKEVDFLKIDIEGMESVVLKELEPKLSLVREIVMEHHVPRKSEELNSLKDIINILRKNGFIVRSSWKDLIVALVDLFLRITGQTSISIVRAVKLNRIAAKHQIC